MGGVPLAGSSRDPIAASGLLGFRASWASWVQGWGPEGSFKSSDKGLGFRV